jgi:hypothetical protein
MQIVDLCQILREEAFLRAIGEQLGQVITIDTSEAYKAKLLGPRIRLLVQDPNDLPQSIVIPRFDGEGEAEYELEFSGLPNQCGRCRARDHQVRNCPKIDPAKSRKSTRTRQRAEKRGTTELNLPTEYRPPTPDSMTKGECSTRTTEQTATPTSPTIPGKDLNNKTTTRNGQPGKEKLPLGDSELIPPRLPKPVAEATQVDDANSTQVILPPPLTYTHNPRQG